MRSERRTPLLSPGHEEWARINAEEAEQLRASNMALTIHGPLPVEPIPGLDI